MDETKPDMVNHPPHYKGHASGVECIEITRHMDFCLGNAVKYLFRREKKGNLCEDLKKAVWYINQEIERYSAESWAAWPRDARYEISSTGRVRRAMDGRIRKPVQLKNKYLTFVTVTEGKHHCYYVHRAVAETFLGVIPKGMHVCHRDGNPANNNVINLRIDSVKGNSNDKIRHGTRNWGAKQRQAKLKPEDVTQIRQSLESEQSLALKFDVSHSTIGRVRRGEAWVDRKHDYNIAFEKYLRHEPPSNVANALELILRAGQKGNAVEDLQKAVWYLQDEIYRLENWGQDK
jgi:hypothetical protein